MLDETIYIKDSMVSEGVLTFYVKSSRYFISRYKNNTWRLYFDNDGNFELLKTFSNVDEVFESIILDNKTIEELLVIGQNDYEFV